MISYPLLIGLIWLVFICYWFVSALNVKRSVRNGAWRRWLWLRLFFIVIAIFVLHFAGANVRVYLSLEPLGPSWAALGVVVAALGVALAIWARVYLGRNWGMPMTLREEPELVTTGPYRYIRHPIYSGMLLALLGSAFADSLFWLLPLAGACIYFVYSSFAEDRHMAELFPSTYPAYKARTKMLIPFIF